MNEPREWVLEYTKFSTYAYTIHHEVYCSINYKYIRIPRASERRDSIAPRPGSIERTLVFFSVLSYTKCGQCTVLDDMSTAVRIRLYARARSLVRGRTSMLQLYVQLCKFVYVGTGSKVPVPGQKYRFNWKSYTNWFTCNRTGMLSFCLSSGFGVLS